MSRQPELEKILQEAVVLSRADTSIDVEHLPSRMRKPPATA